MTNIPAQIEAVLDYLVRGYNRSEIATALDLSYSTVTAYIQRGRELYKVHDDFHLLAKLLNARLETVRTNLKEHVDERDIDDILAPLLVIEDIASSQHTEELGIEKTPVRLGRSPASKNPPKPKDRKFLRIAGKRLPDVPSLTEGR